MPEITELMYDRVKGTLREQATHHDALVSRIHTMFVATTAIVGVGLPLALSQIPNDEPLKNLLLWLAIIPLVIYIIAAWIAFSGLVMSKIQTVDAPSWVRTDFAGKSDDKFRSEMWEKIEKYHRINDGVLHKKGRAADFTRWGSATLTVVVVVYVIVVVVISVN